MKKTTLQESPLTMKISFNVLMQRYEEQLTTSSDPDVIHHARKVLALGEKYPELRNGITDLDRINALKPEIDLILRDAFNPLLTHNEIKTVSTAASQVQNADSFQIPFFSFNQFIQRGTHGNTGNLIFPESSDIVVLSH